MKRGQVTILKEAKIYTVEYSPDPNAEGNFKAVEKGLFTVSMALDYNPIFDVTKTD